MKLVHCQVALAVAVVVAAGAGVAAMNASSESARLKQQIADAQRGPVGVPKQPERSRVPGADPDGQLRAERLRAAGLENKIKQLDAANAQLQKERDDARAQLAVASTRTAAPLGTMASAQPETFVAPPPPPPPSQSHPEPGSWGAAETSEMAELVTAINLTPEQTEAARKIIMDAQEEFQNRLIDAQRNGERDIHVIEKIGDEVSKKTQDRMSQMLFPEQQQKFKDYMHGKEQAR